MNLRLLLVRPEIGYCNLLDMHRALRLLWRRMLCDDRTAQSDFGASACLSKEQKVCQKTSGFPRYVLLLLMALIFIVSWICGIHSPLLLFEQCIALLLPFLCQKI
jgi:hypothetical protein